MRRPPPPSPRMRRFIPDAHHRRRVIPYETATLLARRAPKDIKHYQARPQALLGCFAPDNATLFNNAVAQRWRNCRAIGPAPDPSRHIVHFIERSLGVSPILLKSETYGSLNPWGIELIAPDHSFTWSTPPRGLADWVGEPISNLYKCLIPLSSNDDEEVDLLIVNSVPCGDNEQPGEHNLVNHETWHHYPNVSDGVIYNTRYLHLVSTTNQCWVLTSAIAMGASGRAYYWAPM